MKNADMPAMPQANEEVFKAFVDVEEVAPLGLTKREEIAARMAAAMLQSGDIETVNLMKSLTTRDRFSETAVNIADALLDSLERR